MLLVAASEPAKQPVTAIDLLKIERVTSVEVARDGSFAIYGVQSIHTQPAADSKGEPTYSYRTNLWRVDLTHPGAQPVELTWGARNDSDPQLSPDGKILAFVRVDASQRERQRPQVWLMPVGTAGEARMITHLEYGATAPRWRPDGKVLLVASPIPISKIEGKPHFALDRPGRDWFDWDRPAKDDKNAKIDARPDGDLRSIRNWLERNASRDNPTVITRMAFLGELGLQREMTITHVFVIDLEHDNKATEITKDFYNHGDFSYSPDGRRIVYVSSPRDSRHPDRIRRTAVWQMNADGSEVQPILDQAAYSFRSPRFSSDGNSLVLAAQQTDQPTFRQAKLARYDLASKQITWLAPEWDSSAGGVRIASDGSILFTSNWHGGAPLERLNADNNGLRALVDGPVGVSAFDEGGGRVVFAEIDVPDPNELYVIEKDGSVRRLTELNTGWLRNKTLVMPVEHWLTRPDGVKIEYWVMNPANAEQGKKYPWVLDMHGGPSAMWGPGEFTMWHEFQLFCSFGYGVVYANPRGSGGYGYQFQKGNYKDWGDGPTGDVLAALDETTRDNPLVDKDRLFLTGGSYAGYLTAWVVGHDHRFKAAAAQRGVYELSTFYGESNAFRLVENSFGGFPWQPEAKKLLDRESPFSYVADIRTPRLILHGSNDFRTGFAQSEMLYRALKEMGKPVEYIRYPNIGHELTRSGPPLQRLDHMLRIIEFFERYAHNDRPAPQATQ